MAKNTSSRVDLSLIKRLVAALETSLTDAEDISQSSDKNNYVVEMSKAAGIAAAIMTEGAMLVGDIQHLVQGGAAMPGSKNTTEFLEKILSGIKGPGNTN